MRQRDDNVLLDCANLYENTTRENLTGRNREGKAVAIQNLQARNPPRISLPSVSLDSVSIFIPFLVSMPYLLNLCFVLTSTLSLSSLFFPLALWPVCLDKYRQYDDSSKEWAWSVRYKRERTPTYRALLFQYKITICAPSAWSSL